MELAELYPPSFPGGKAAESDNTSIGDCNQQIAASHAPMPHFLNETTMKTEVLDEAILVRFDGPVIEVANSIKIFRSRGADYYIAGHDTGPLNAVRNVT